MNNYKFEQTTMELRSKRSITAHKILDIEGNDLVIRLWLNRDDTERFHVTGSENYEIGQYVDFVILRTGKASHTTKLIGKTPEQFIPVDGSDIY